MTYRQDPPFAVQIELVEGCPLRCSFCGLNGIRGKNNDYKFMDSGTLRSLIEQMSAARWNPRVEFAVHGEPSMHPNLIGMVRLARECAPKFQLMMTSNGAGLVKKPGPAANVTALFEAGLNVLALDDYEGVKFVDKIRDDWTARGDASVSVFEYPENRAGSPHARVGIRERKLVFIQDISKAERGNHSLLNNHAGSGAPPVGPDHPSQRQRCAKPFRELTVRWDGNVAVCCNDWRGEYKCGSVFVDGLDAVWNGPAMRAARQKLVRGERDFGPCRGCDAVSYRVGLLPDKFGKVTMPAPNAETARQIKKATAGAPYTARVAREWEK